MAKNNKSKLKLLYLKQIFEEYTDAAHGITMAELLELLESYGVAAERKSVSRDIKTLCEYGLDIEKFAGNPARYALVNREFDLSELMLLVDAVQSCKFLTSKQANYLAQRLKLLTSEHEQALLDRRIHVPDRITSKVDGVFQDIDLLHDAMNKHCKASFTYYRYGADGKRHATRDGKKHVVTPVAITYEDGYYYLSAWDDEYDKMAEYRIDRMGALALTDEVAASNDEITHYTFEGDEYELFGRFEGEPVITTLAVDANKAEIIMDRFGEAAQWFVRSNSQESAEVTVKIRKSEQFFGWITGLGGTVRICSPESLKQEYVQYLLERTKD